MPNAAEPTLTDFVLARINEDEEFARAVADSHEMWGWESYVAGAGMYGEPASEFAARYDPIRVLADCEARRRMVVLSADDGPYGDWFLRLLAQPHSDHPDYRPEWRV